MEMGNTDATGIRLEVMDTSSGVLAAEEGSIVKQAVTTTKIDEPKNGTVLNNHKDEMNGENDERKAAIRLCKTSKHLSSVIDKTERFALDLFPEIMYKLCLAWWVGLK